MQADTIIIGSGVAGALAAHRLAQAGQKVLVVERGEWVRRGPWNSEPEATVDFGPHTSRDCVYDATTDHGRRAVPAITCVGGMSVFAGAVALRYRERDFAPDDADLRRAGASWPFRYAEIERYYAEAEALLGVSRAEDDPVAPPGSTKSSIDPPPLTPVSSRIATAGAALGLTPFRLPLAINRGAQAGRGTCSGCETCDTFACSVSAKNDAATAILRPLVARGLRLFARTTAVRLVHDGGHVTGVHCVGPDGRTETLRARTYILAAGALATPHLLLSSALEHESPAGHVVGRYLTRHCNAIVMGVFPRPLPDGRRFHKHVGFHDLYEGAGGANRGGAIQQVPSPPVALIASRLPVHLRRFAPRLVARLTGLLAMAEDVPCATNRVLLDPHTRRPDGMLGCRIEHRYTDGDLAARDHLVSVSRRILRRAGAIGFYVHPVDTFSHAGGTVRMGADARSAPLAADGSFRGTDNLYVADASALPTSAAVNPSLTIAANALRIADRIAATQGSDEGVLPHAA